MRFSPSEGLCRAPRPSWRPQPVGSRLIPRQTHSTFRGRVRGRRPARRLFACQAPRTIPVTPSGTSQAMNAKLSSAPPKRTAVWRKSLRFLSIRTFLWLMSPGHAADSKIEIENWHSYIRACLMCAKHFLNSEQPGRTPGSRGPAVFTGRTVPGSCRLCLRRKGGRPETAAAAFSCVRRRGPPDSSGGGEPGVETAPGSTGGVRL